MNAADRKEKRRSEAPRRRKVSAPGAAAAPAPAERPSLGPALGSASASSGDAATPEGPVPATTSGWCVYLVRCRDASLYAGCTNDLARRLVIHNAGRGAAYTRSRGPVELVWWEPQPDRSAALRREWALKQLTRRQKLALVTSAPPRSIPGAP